jgi:sugar (pentulose or hexulose) kinase
MVVGIDSSTTSTKAIAFDPDGKSLAEGRATVPMSQPEPGAFEQEPADWWAALVGALTDLGRQVDLSAVQALTIANQRETVGFLDRKGDSVRPAIVWLDERCRPDITILSEALSAERLHQISGKAPDLTPAVYKLNWLRRTRPDGLAGIDRIVDVHGYLTYRLTGERRTSWASADPHGLYDLEQKHYSPEILEWFDLTEDSFFSPERPGTLLGRVTAGAAETTGLSAGIPLAAGGGDGQCAALGCGVLRPGSAYLNLGTATVFGVFTSDYVVDRAFRTVSSLTGDGYLCEYVLRTGAFLTDWLMNLLGQGVDSAAFTAIEQAAKGVPVGSDGLLLLPYWSGAMQPHWDPDARGAMIGLGSNHQKAHLYRALIEGIALDLASGLHAVEAVTGSTIERFIAIGGGARSALWRQIVADATGKDVQVSETVEASCLGAGMIAAVTAGWYPDIPAAVAAMAGRLQGSQRPDPGVRDRYRRMQGLYEGLYPALRQTFAGLAAFREEFPA